MDGRFESELDGWWALLCSTSQGVVVWGDKYGKFPNMSRLWMGLGLGTESFHAWDWIRREKVWRREEGKEERKYDDRDLGVIG